MFEKARRLAQIGRKPQINSDSRRCSEDADWHGLVGPIETDPAFADSFLRESARICGFLVVSARICVNLRLLVVWGNLRQICGLLVVSARICVNLRLLVVSAGICGCPMPPESAVQKKLRSDPRPNRSGDIQGGAWRAVAYLTPAALLLFSSFALSVYVWASFIKASYLARSFSIPA